MLRMTARTGNGKSKDNSNRKCKDNRKGKGNGAVVVGTRFGWRSGFLRYAAHMKREQLRSK
jgi:hypothetical protein